MEAWYCGIFEPNSDRLVEQHLAALGHRTFVPRLCKWVSHARRRKAVERPFLGRYFFVEVDGQQQGFGALRSARGLDGMLSIEGRPIEIPRPEVEGLLRRYLEGEWDQVRDDAIPLKARITIVEGQFSDLLGTVIGRKRSIATVQIDGHKNPVKIPEISLRPA